MKISGPGPTLRDRGLAPALVTESRTPGFLGLRWPSLALQVPAAVRRFDAFAGFRDEQRLRRNAPWRAYLCPDARRAAPGQPDAAREAEWPRSDGARSTKGDADPFACARSRRGQADC